MVLRCDASVLEEQRAVVGEFTLSNTFTAHSHTEMGEAARLFRGVADRPEFRHLNASARSWAFTLVRGRCRCRSIGGLATAPH